MSANHLESDPAQGQLTATRRQDVVPHGSAGSPHDRSGPVYEVRASASRIVESTDHLLSRARMQWQFGDWHSLLALDLLAIEHHPGRAELALLSGCAALQVGQRDAAKRFLSAAESWGCHPELMARLLLAGVANSLGRYHALKGNYEASEAYFLEAAAGLGGDPLLAARARQQQELQSLQPALAITPPAREYLPVLSSSSTRVEKAASGPPGAPETAHLDATTIVYRPQLVSYSQNMEDVLLWRVLGHINNGFFIDVGANDPTYHSVSRAFRERGWTGVHIEPLKQAAARLRADCPRDQVLEAAVSDGCGISSLRAFCGDAHGLSTLSHETALEHTRSDYRYEETECVLITLDDVFASIGNRDVHWMKIDVEGYEKQALVGWRCTSVKPWVVCIEATAPCSSRPTWNEWEDDLLCKGYQLALFDGLNRFYCSDEHLELMGTLSVPVNSFDQPKSL